jgi:hypothetical protein
MRILFEHMPHLQEYEFLFKVTGKYFVPELESVAIGALDMYTIPDVLIQAERDESDNSWVNCEVFGMQPAMMTSFFNNIQWDDPTGLEYLLKQFADKHNSMRMPRMTNAFQSKRGDCLTLKYL